MQMVNVFNVSKCCILSIRRKRTPLAQITLLVISCWMW